MTKTKEQQKTLRLFRRTAKRKMTKEIQKNPDVVREQKSLVRTQSIEVHQGPLPAPEDLARYDQIVPGAGKAIIEMAQSALAHSQDIDRRLSDREDTAMKLDYRLAATGQVFGFLLIAALLCFSGYFLATGKEVGAVTSIIGTVVVVVGQLYAKGKQSRQK